MASSTMLSPEKRATILQFFYRQLFVTPQPISRVDADLTGKTAIVTGATGGLGLEAARNLLELGCRVILAVRDTSKGESARQSLAESLAQPQAQGSGSDTAAAAAAAANMIEVWDLDLSSYPSIQDFAERVSGLRRLDIAILCAGVYKVHESFVESAGYEDSIQINYLSNMLLTLLLLPSLKPKTPSTQPGRIVVVSTDQAAWAKFPEANNPGPLLSSYKQPMTHWNFNERYGTSKLLGQLFLHELSQRVPSSAVIISFANCGFCRGSDLGRQFTGLAKSLLDIAFAILGRECSVGARSFVHAVTTLGKDAHGQYIEDGTVQAMAPICYKPQGLRVAKQLFEETLDELSFAGVKDVVGTFHGAK